MNEFFGESREPEGERQLKVKWPLRPLNLVESAINGAMGEALAIAECGVPMIFIENDEFANAEQWAALFGPVTVHEAIALRDIVLGDVQEKFRRQLIVARELGENASWDLYAVACEAEGIEILKGPNK
jgi:hypothetical protein